MQEYMTVITSEGVLCRVSHTNEKRIIIKVPTFLLSDIKLNRLEASLPSSILSA